MLSSFQHASKLSHICDKFDTLLDALAKLSVQDINDKDFKILHDPSNIHLDKPNPPVVKMAQMFADDGFNIVIFSQ